MIKWFSLFSTKILSLVGDFIIFFFYFFNWFFYFLLFFLFLLNASLFCGDVTHGRGSYLLIMHSTLAIICKLLWYFFILFFFFYFVFFFYLQKYYYYYYLFYYYLFHIALFSLIYYFLFLITGLVWGDYSWGFSISIEFRFILLCLYLLFFSIVVFYFYFFNSFVLFFYIVCSFILLILLIQLVSWLQMVPFMLDFLSFLNLNLNRIELHQSDESLHFFLLSISGYYVSLVMIYVIYLFFLCFFYIFIIFYFFFFLIHFYIQTWYFVNINMKSFYFNLFFYLI